MPWINDVIQVTLSHDYSDAGDDEGLMIGFRRLSPTKLVFYPRKELIYNNIYRFNIINLPQSTA